MRACRSYLAAFMFLLTLSLFSQAVFAFSFNVLPKSISPLNRLLLRLHQGPVGAFSIATDPSHPLPTEVVSGANTTAYFVITNNATHTTRTGFVASVPNHTSVVAGVGCGQTFTLAPQASCTLQLTVSGSVNNQPVLYVCDNTRTACTGFDQAWNVSEASATSLAVTPSDQTLNVGDGSQYTAMVYSADGTGDDVTASSTWTSSDTTVASVNSTGFVYTDSAGVSLISAAFGGLTASSFLTVHAPRLTSITVTPANAVIDVAGTITYLATGHYSDGSSKDITSSVSWTSSDTSVATITGGGVATGVSDGATTISATIPGSSVIGQTGLTVTGATLTQISITPADSSVAAGLTLSYTATGTYSDGTTAVITDQVTWSSSNTGVATISNTSGSKGVATGVAAGSTTISAQKNGITAHTGLTVTAANLVSIAVTPSSPHILVGNTQAFVATGTYTDGTTSVITTSVTWSSDNTSIVTISNTAPNQGVATAVAAGTTQIHATLSGIIGTTNVTVSAASLVSIAVTPADKSVADGETQAYTAMGTFSNGQTRDITSAVTWSVLPIQPPTSVIATITSQGVATVTASSGESTIQATSGSITGSTTLTALPPELTGLEIEPNPTDPVGVGKQTYAFAIGTYSDGSSQAVAATWSTLNPTVATATAGTSGGLPVGIITGVSSTVNSGQTTVIAKAGGFTATAPVTVVASLQSITVTPATKTIPVLTAVSTPGTQQYTATGNYSDGTQNDITTTATWSSSATNVATISNTRGSIGLATAVSQGSTSITATAQGVTSSPVATLTVAGPVPVSLAITPTAPSVPNGISQTFTATVTYADNTTATVTTSSTWTSSNTAVATIGASTGVASTHSVGTTQIGASYSQVIGGVTYVVTASPVTLTVTTATVTSVAITSPSSPVSVPQGQTQQFTATATYTDASTRDVTTQATWASSNTAQATISNTTPTVGLATVPSSATVGLSTNITAAFGGQTSSAAVLTVTASQIVSIAVTPASAVKTYGNTQTYTATATLSDGNTSDVTGTVTWSSSNTALVTMTANVATVQSTTGLQPGTVTISATESGKTGTASLQVAPTGAAIVGYSDTSGITNPFAYTLGNAPGQTTPFYLSSYLLPTNATANTPMEGVSCISGTSTCVGVGTNQASGAGVIFRSTDRGLTWTQSSAISAVGPLTLDSISCSGGNCFAAGYYPLNSVYVPAVYTSTDNGVTFSPTVTIPTSAFVTSVQLTGVSCNTSTCYAVGNNLSGGTSPLDSAPIAYMFTNASTSQTATQVSILGSVSSGTLLTGVSTTPDIVVMVGYNFTSASATSVFMAGGLVSDTISVISTASIANSRLNSVSCVSNSACMAAGSQGGNSLVLYTNASPLIQWSGEVDFSSVGALYGINCTGSLCVTVGDSAGAPLVYTAASTGTPTFTAPSNSVVMPLSSTGQFLGVSQIS